MSAIRILISHNVEEKDLAGAWQKLVETISSKAVEVWFSSDTSPLGGMTIGKEWRDDLYQRLKDCTFVLAIQTPVSAGKPWVMWECGVASGVGKERGIIPIVYGMGRGSLPNPLNVFETYQGDDIAQVREVCVRLAQQAGLTPPNVVYTRAMKTYMSAVELHRSRKMVSTFSGNITLWTNRINELVQGGRINELNSLRKQMYASLGTPPLDSTLHALLGQLLLQHRNYQATIEETEYALELAPNDIPLLHRKALALVGLYNYDEAKKVIKQIIAQDKNLNVDTEVASLIGRIHREQWLISQNPNDLNAALDAYNRAYQADPNSYYAGINVVGLAFAKGDSALATRVAKEVLALCQEEQHQSRVSFWADFTAGEAYLALDDGEQAIKEYERGMGRPSQPMPLERESATKGATRMVKIKNLPDSILARIKAVL